MDKYSLIVRKKRLTYNILNKDEGNYLYFLDVAFKAKEGPVIGSTIIPYHIINTPKHRKK
jgi:hypothetical protein